MLVRRVAVDRWPDVAHSSPGRLNKRGRIGHSGQDRFSYGIINREIETFALRTKRQRRSHFVTRRIGSYTRGEFPVGARRKHLSGSSTPKERRFIADTATHTRKSRAAEKAYLEQKNVKASENKKQTDPTASSPQEKPRSSPADPKAPMEEQENATRQTSKNEQALPPRDPGTPRKTRILPERQLIDSSLPTLFPPPPAPPPTPPAPSAAEPPEPTATLADIGWMPRLKIRLLDF